MIILYFVFKKSKNPINKIIQIVALMLFDLSPVITTEKKKPSIIKINI